MTADEKLVQIRTLLELVWSDRAKVLDPTSSWSDKDQASRIMAACLSDIRHVVNEWIEGGAADAL